MNTPMSVSSPQTLGDILQSVLIKGNLAKLTPQERVNYYNAVCESVGLNPLTRPFDYIVLNGNLTLYARKDCTDQLRKIYNISLELADTHIKDGILSVRAKARMPYGNGLVREDEDIGAIALPDNIKGEFRANMLMKCCTKAKRRVTLSICGLGFLDESEVEGSHGTRARSLNDALDMVASEGSQQVDAETGELSLDVTENELDAMAIARDKTAQEKKHAE
jgi:hypothetical protein